MPARDAARLLLPILVSLLAGRPAAAGSGGMEPHAMPARQAESIELATEEVSVPLELDSGRPVVAVMIAGKGPYRFIVDTGAQGAVVASSLAEELAMPVLGEAQLGSPGGTEKVPSKLVRIERLDLGGARITGLSAATMDLDKLFAAGNAPRGVLSASAFPGFLLTLDYPAGRLTLRKGELPPADGASVFEYGAAADLPTLPLSVAGLEIPAHLDSGSSGGVSLPKSYIPKLPLAAPPVESGRMRLADRESIVLSGRLEGTLKVGRFALENPSVSFGDLPMANLGFGWLRGYSITLDSRMHRLRLDRDDAAMAAPAPAPKRYGVRIHPSADGAFEVEGSDPGSPAEKAGLRGGDRIVSIDGTPVAGLEGARLGEMLRRSPVKLVIERDGRRSEIEMSLD